MTPSAQAFGIQDEVFEVSGPNQLGGIERRAKVRYPIPLKVRYRAVGQRLPPGEGQALNLSSGGALILCRHELARGAELEMYIEWPSLLNGCIRLQLVASGSVVRCTASNFAVCFRRYQFRTLGSKPQPIAASGREPKMPPELLSGE